MQSTGNGGDRPPNTLADGGGFCRVQWAVVDRMGDIGHAPIVVYLAILRHADRDGVAWPSLSRLATVSGLSKRTVIRAVGELASKGLIHVEHQGAKGQVMGANKYRILRYAPPVGVVTGLSLGSDTHVTGVVTDLSLGSDTGVTGVVTPEHHEVEPINQNQEVEPLNQSASAPLAASRGKKQLIEVEIPDSLNTPEFCAAWGDWKRYLRERRKTLAPSTIRGQFKKLEQMGPTTAVVAIHDSIANGWIGIFPPKPNNATSSPARRSPVNTGTVYDPNATSDL